MKLQSLLLALAGVALSAAPAFSETPLTFSIGGGPTVPGKYAGRHFNTGFNFKAGAGIHPIRAVGVMAEFGFNRLGLTYGALSRVGVSDGSGRIYSATLNPMVHRRAGSTCI